MDFTGGDSGGKFLDTTEVFYGWRWSTLTAKLPIAMNKHASATVNNRVFISGKKTFELNGNSSVWNIVLIFYI